MRSRAAQGIVIAWGLVAAACTPAGKGPTTPPGGASTPGTTGPPSPAVPEAAAPEDREMIAIDEFAGQVCGLARSGALLCWGHVMATGKTTMVTAPRPMRLEGVPALEGFAAVRGGLVGWDAEGDVVSISDDLGQGFRAREGVFLATVQGSGAVSGELRRLRVRAASQRCLLTTQGQLLCNGPADQGTWFYDRFPGEYRALGTGSMACAIDGAGRAIAINAERFALDGHDALGGKTMASFTTRPIAGLPADATSLACAYGNLTGGKERRPIACAVDAERALRCTDSAVAKALERAAEGVAIRSVFADEHLCVLRDDGQARCVATHYFPAAPLLASLTGLDASRGLALGPGSICALDEDGLPRCWGEHGVPQLGDGSVLELAAPVHVEGFDGAIEVSHSGGITCVRDSAERVRCFGRFGSTVIEPRALKLPEPVDAMVGGDPLCVRGSKSQAWYCRDPLQSFFGGSLPDHLTPVVDRKGRKLGKEVVSLAVDLGVGVHVALRDGRSGWFLYRGVRQPLRIVLGAGPQMLRAVVPGGAIRTDGRGEFERSDAPFVTRGPVAGLVSVAGRPCFLDDAAQLSCYDETLERATVIAREIATVDPLGGALTKQGDVLGLAIVDGTVVATKREGLPAMAQLAGPCGRSENGEIWCWGTLEHLPGPPHRLEPRPVAFGP